MPAGTYLERKVNPRALGLCERHGFRRTGETDTHYLLER